MQTNKPYTDEFKRSVVEHWLESGKSARKVAEEFGIGSSGPFGAGANLKRQSRNFLFEDGHVQWYRREKIGVAALWLGWTVYYKIEI